MVAAEKGLDNIFTLFLLHRHTKAHTLLTFIAKLKLSAAKIFTCKLSFVHMCVKVKKHVHRLWNVLWFHILGHFRFQRWASVRMSAGCTPCTFCQAVYEQSLSADGSNWIPEMLAPLVGCESVLNNKTYNACCNKSFLTVDENKAEPNSLQISLVTAGLSSSSLNYLTSPYLESTPVLWLYRWLSSF